MYLGLVVVAILVYELLVEKEYKAESAVNTLHSLIKKAGAKMIIYATQPNNIGSTFSVNSTSFYLTDLQIEQILTRNNFKIANDYEGLVAAPDSLINVPTARPPAKI